MYSFLTFAQATAQLAARLEDPNLTYWSQPNELLNCVIESVRLYQVLTGSYKQKIAFPTVANTNYYDLPALAASVSYNATDVEVANNVLAALLEPPLPASGPWVGTGQFSFTQLQSALQNRLNRFLSDTGCRVVQQNIGGPPPPVDIVSLPRGTLDVRRVAWVPVPGSPSLWGSGFPWTPGNYPWQSLPTFQEFPLGRLDEWAEQAYIPGAPQNPSQPISYSVFSAGPEALRLVPPPSDEGIVDLLLVAAGPQVQLNPASPTALNIPDDLSPALKWGVLADLLGADGPSRDFARAQYCEQRYQEFVQLASIYPSVLTADVNNITCGIGSVFDMDFYQPDWQQQTGPPSFIGMCGRNLACAGQTPDAVYGVGLWMAVNAPTTGYLQVNRGAIDPVLDYAQHIASFKMGGAEFFATVELHQRFLDQAAKYNSKLKEMGQFSMDMQEISQRNEQRNPRMAGAR